MPISGQHLLNRRQQLVARCEVERIDLIQRSQEVQSLMRAIDSTVHTMQQIRQHPGVVIGVLTAVLLIVRPKRLGTLLGNVVSASKTLQVVAPVIQRLRQRI